MKTDNGESTSVWMPTPATRAASQLTTDVETDVCIIGAGIAGMTTAYLLAREGRRVVVLDDGPVAGGETCRTTARVKSVPVRGSARLRRLPIADWSVAKSSFDIWQFGGWQWAYPPVTAVWY